MLNDRLKEARLRAKLTQKEIADAAGYPGAEVILYEHTGFSKISIYQEAK